MPAEQNTPITITDELFRILVKEAKDIEQQRNEETQLESVKTWMSALEAYLVSKKFRVEINRYSKEGENTKVIIARISNDTKAVNIIFNKETLTVNNLVIKIADNNTLALLCAELASQFNLK